MKSNETMFSQQQPRGQQNFATTYPPPGTGFAIGDGEQTGMPSNPAGFNRKRKAPKGDEGQGPASKTPFMLMNEKFPIVNQLIKWQEGMDPSGKKFYRCFVEVRAFPLCLCPVRLQGRSQEGGGETLS
ncbi:MAG: hypothetical protein GY696_37755 [Gammaproteobacteria bacterium]|nr:hypothetical protein [Gammaproteobacteria bacterium]